MAAPSDDREVFFPPTLRMSEYKQGLDERIHSAKQYAHASRSDLVQTVGPAAVARAEATGSFGDLGVPTEPPERYLHVARLVQTGSNMHHLHALYSREREEAHAAFVASDAAMDQKHAELMEAIHARGPPILETDDPRIMTAARVALHGHNVRMATWIRGRKHEPTGLYPWHVEWAKRKGQDEGRTIILDKYV